MSNDPLIRPARSDDRAAVLALVPRLAEHGTPPGRDRAQVEAADLESITAAFDAPRAGAALFVAELDGRVVGFLHVLPVRDYYTGATITHVSDVVVAAEAEGHGLGRHLVAQAEAWAREQGHALVQLYVLPENTGARALYERAGFTPEWLKYVKPVA